jgi:hypothetical protein
VVDVLVLNSVVVLYNVVVDLDSCVVFEVATTVLLPVVNSVVVLVLKVVVVE